MDQLREQPWNGEATLESPFAETALDPRQEALGESEMASPFAEALEASLPESERDQLLAEAFAELRDEAFDAAVSALAEETEQAVADRFTGEAPGQSGERERFADNYLSPVRFEAERYLNALEAGLAGLDFGSLTEEQLDEKLDQFDPQLGEVTPAGEEFIGGLIRKAKKAVKFVANAAKSVGGLAGKLLSPVLGRLKKLIEPLLKRVLQFAIGRLPAPLRPAARELAKRITLEAEEGEGEAEQWEGPASEAEEGEELASPASPGDPESLAEEFDAALAEAFAGDFQEGEAEQEEFFDSESETDGRQLEQLAEARSRLIETLKSGDEEAVGPAVEQFVPVLLGALRLGINLVGRPKVVSFLAGYLAKLIGKWVGPQLSQPLSNAIVDTGLRLVSLEAEEEGGGLSSEAGPVALASAIEDTVRRFSEQESYIFESEELTELAAAEAFSEAVSSHFPPQFVRPDLRQAPSLGGTFVARRPRSVRAYRKYSRLPEIEVTPQIADSLPSFGGRTLGGTLRAAGIKLPVRARMHIYQAAPGTTLPSIARTDRSLNGQGRGYVPSSSFHPLTPSAAGLLLREPRLGVASPASFMRSPNRVAVGQRVYVLQPVTAGVPSLPATRAGRMTAARLAPSSARVRIDRAGGRLTARFFFSEAEAQRIARLIREGRGHNALVQALVGAWRTIDPAHSGSRILGKHGEAFEELAPGLPKHHRRLHAHHRHHHHHRRMRQWIIPALAKWARYNAEAFARAAADPASGVTVLVQMGLPFGMARRGLRQSLPGTPPAVAVSVVPGMHG